MSARLRVLADVGMGQAEFKLVETKASVTCLLDVSHRNGLIEGGLRSR